MWRVLKPTSYSTLQKLSTQNISIRGVTTSDLLPLEAKVVICGGGTVANSVAYHLAIRGWTDVVVIDKNTVGSGSSYYGPGTLSLTNEFKARQLISHSISLYKKLHDEGHDVGWKQNGSLNVARTKERMVWLKHRRASTLAEGVESKMITREEIAEYYPDVFTDDLEGGMVVPGDSCVTPQKVCTVLFELASGMGVEYVENCEVRNVFIKNNKVSEVETSLGNIKCANFVNCAGMWAHDLGKRSTPKVRIPSHPVDHYYAVTKRISGRDTTNNPTLRDFDGYSYVREWDGGYLIGGYEKEAKPIYHSSTKFTIPDKLEKGNTENYEPFKPTIEEIKHRLPFLANVDLHNVVNAPDNFSPDGKWIFGECPEIDNYFVATALGGNCTQCAGGKYFYINLVIKHCTLGSP